MTPRPSSSRGADSSPSSRHIPHIDPHQSNDGNDITSPGHQDGNTELAESQNARLYNRSQVMAIDPPLEEQSGRPSHSISRGSSRRSIAATGPPSPTSTDPQSSYVELHRDQDRVSGTDPRNTFGGGITSRRYVSAEESREPPFCELAFVIAETVVGLDLDHDLEDSDEGNDWSVPRQNDGGASRSSFVSTLPYRESDTPRDLAPDMGSGYFQGGQSRNPSRPFPAHLVRALRLTTSWTGTRPSEIPPPDHLGRQNQSSTPVPSTHLDC